MSGGTAAVTAAVAVISTAVSMYSQHEQQKSQEKAAKASAEYNAEVAAQEAATQRQLAQNELGKGIAERNRHARAAAQRQGELASMFGASGFAMDSGSTVGMLGDSMEEEQYDANIITQNANMAAWQHEAAATTADNQKSMFDYQYANAGSGRGASMLGMIGTGLGGIAQGMGQYNDYLKTQTPGYSKGKVYGDNGSVWELTKLSNYKP